MKLKLSKEQVDELKGLSRQNDKSYVRTKSLAIFRCGKNIARWRLR